MARRQIYKDVMFHMVCRSCRLPTVEQHSAAVTFLGRLLCSRCYRPLWALRAEVTK